MINWQFPIEYKCVWKTIVFTALEKVNEKFQSLTDGRGVRLPFATTAIHVGSIQRFMKNKLQLFLNQHYPARIKLDTNTESKVSKNYLEDVLCTFQGLAKQWRTVTWK